MKKQIKKHMTEKFIEQVFQLHNEEFMFYGRDDKEDIKNILPKELEIWDDADLYLICAQEDNFDQFVLIEKVLEGQVFNIKITLLNEDYDWLANDLHLALGGDERYSNVVIGVVNDFN